MYMPLRKFWDKDSIFKGVGCCQEKRNGIKTFTVPRTTLEVYIKTHEKSAARNQLLEV